MWTDRPLRLVAASLLLNVFLVGIVVGHLVVTRAPRVPPPGRALVPATHVRALPPEERRTFAAAMGLHRDTIREARRAHRAARQVVEKAIAAPSYDREALAADFAKLRAANVAVQEAVNDALVDALRNLSPQSRASLVRQDGANPARR